MIENDCNTESNAKVSKEFQNSLACYEELYRERKIAESQSVFQTNWGLLLQDLQKDKRVKIRSRYIQITHSPSEKKDVLYILSNVV